MKIFTADMPQFTFWQWFSNKEMIESAMTTESCQQSLTKEAEIKFGSTTHRSSVLHIAVTHRNVHLVYAMLSPWPKILRPNPRSNSDGSDIPRVDINHKSSNQTVPLDIAVHEQDITLTLLLLSFYDKMGQLPGHEKKSELLQKCTPKQDSDAVTKSKMAAITKVLTDVSIPTPEEIYSNYQIDKKYYDNEFNPSSKSLQSTNSVQTIAAPDVANLTCWKCSVTQNLKACSQCKRTYCQLCFPKQSHLCNK